MYIAAASKKTAEWRSHSPMRKIKNPSKLKTGLERYTIYTLSGHGDTAYQKIPFSIRCACPTYVT